MIVRVLTALLILYAALHAKDIYPSLRLHSVGFVNDFVRSGEYLYVANDRGTVDIFDLNTQKIIHQIAIAPLVTSRGELIPASILSVDIFNGKVLLVSNTQDNFRNVWIYEDYTLKQIVNERQKLLIKEAHFVDDERIVLATFDSDMILYDTKEQSKVYQRHISQSTLGDIVLSADKSKIIMSDESGEVKILDLEDSQVKEELKSENVDNVYHVAHSQGVTITAGQDRRVGVYQNGKKPYHIKSDFLVYCVGISPSGKTGVYSSGEEHILQLFNISTKQKTDRLIGHKSIINQIKFINEKELFSSQQGNDVLFWRLD